MYQKVSACMPCNKQICSAPAAVLLAKAGGRIPGHGRDSRSQPCQHIAFIGSEAENEMVQKGEASGEVDWNNTRPSAFIYLASIQLGNTHLIALIYVQKGLLKIAASWSYGAAVEMAQTPAMTLSSSPAPSKAGDSLNASRFQSNILQFCPPSRPLLMNLAVFSSLTGSSIHLPRLLAWKARVAIALHTIMQGLSTMNSPALGTGESH
ncbi:hypothetical protein DUI87_21249 [Hirundo rustica rustica]|uniref:Uncharacterized protein n=1 Tax=Hirundo rustica rustica TaxID=333673 RepID=A0A3M0K4U7_HIRRU|nr:hypothetical protein DUI87_21249 [Hirundo rustica rustica]